MIAHNLVSTKTDSGDSSVVSKNAWNDAHYIMTVTPGTGIAYVIPAGRAAIIPYRLEISATDSVEISAGAVLQIT